MPTISKGAPERKFVPGVDQAVGPVVLAGARGLTGKSAATAGNLLLPAGQPQIAVNGSFLLW
jgi:hypothetical protein